MCEEVGVVSPFQEPGDVAELLVHLTAKSHVRVWPATFAETCMWGKPPIIMLALYTGKDVTPEVVL